MTKKTIIKSTGTVGGMTLISRILGFIRDVIIARIFGAGAGADAFFVAFKIPNFMRRLFAEGAFSQAFVPVFAEIKTQHPFTELRTFTSDVAGTLGGFLLLITGVGVLAAPWLVMVFAPGFLDDPDKYQLTVDMLRITFPYLFFIALTALAGGVLNSHQQFGVPALTPVLLNISLISAALWLAPHLEVPITALAWGVLVAGIAQLLFQFPFLHRLNLLPMPRWRWKDPGVQRVVTLMIPAIFGSSIAQINLLFDTLIASFLVTGSVSWLYYSDRLVEFPLGLFGVALATVILPNLSAKYATASEKEFTDTLDWALRWVILTGTPAALGLFMLSGPMLTTLFQYGQFSASDVEMATYSLMAYSIGLLGFILVKVLAPGFYARQDTRTPVRIGIIALLSNMVLNVVFVLPMVIWDIPGPHSGLALATSISAFINAGLLFYVLRRIGVYQPRPGWLRLIFQVLAANACMVAVLAWGASDLSQWLQWTVTHRILSLVLWVGVGGGIYVVVLWLVGIRGPQMKQLLKQK